MTRMCLPVIIIGAPRSGTNMIRDVLCKLPGFETWPCDEINYIWRHGNMRYASDEFTPEMARPEVVGYIQRSFYRFAVREQLTTVVEKTCANSLRVEFLDRIFPEARYVYILRDGLDTVASARKRWKAGLDIPYLLRKVRYVPLTDLPFYASRYFLNRLYRLFSREKRSASWGPVFNGLDEVLKKHSLEEVCALQWQRCVDRADQAFESIAPERICRVSYETFVANPAEELRRIASFMSIELDRPDAEKLVHGVLRTSVGKGRQEFGDEMVERLEHMVGSTLKRHGYLS